MEPNEEISSLKGISCMSRSAHPVKSCHIAFSKSGGRPEDARRRDQTLILTLTTAAVEAADSQHTPTRRLFAASLSDVVSFPSASR